MVVSKFVMNCPAQPPRRGDHAGTWFSHGKALTDLPLLQDTIDARTDLIGLAYIWIMFGLLACVYSTYITLHILHPRRVKCVIKRSSWLSQGSDCAFSNLRLVLGYCIPPRMSSYLSYFVISSSHLATGPEGELLSSVKAPIARCSCSFHILSQSHVVQYVSILPLRALCSCPFQHVSTYRCFSFEPSGFAAHCCISTVSFRPRQKLTWFQKPGLGVDDVDICWIMLMAQVRRGSDPWIDAVETKGRLRMLLEGVVMSCSQSTIFSSLKRRSIEYFRPLRCYSMLHPTR